MEGILLDAVVFGFDVAALHVAIVTMAATGALFGYMAEEERTGPGSSGPNGRCTRRSRRQRSSVSSGPLRSSQGSRLATRIQVEGEPFVPFSHGKSTPGSGSSSPHGGSGDGDGALWSDRPNNFLRGTLREPAPVSGSPERRTQNRGASCSRSTEAGEKGEGRSCGPPYPSPAFLGPRSGSGISGATGPARDWRHST